ncbi:unnamed protein product, partial [marine sediment metagenome]
SEFDKGWILGFIEGEASFTNDIQGGRAPKGKEPVHIPRFTVNQTNKTPLEFLMSFFGGGHIYKRNYQGKDYWSSRKSTRYDYFVTDRATLEKVREFCDGKLKHPGKRLQFKRWKKLFSNYVGEEGQKEMARQEMISRWKDPKYREKMRKAHIKRWDDEGRKRMSEALKKLWADPEYREMQKVARRKKHE